MKFLKEKNLKKQAFTLVELLIAMFISSIIFFIMFTFIIDNLSEIHESDQKTSLLSEVLSFRDTLDKNIKTWYSDMSKISDNNFNVLILKDLNWEKGIMYWVVDANTNRLASDYLYWKNQIWYRLLSQTEINNIEADLDVIYDFYFFQDKIYNSMYVKDFLVNFYNSWAVLDLDVSLFGAVNESMIWESFTWGYLDNSDVLDFNFVF